MTWVKQARQMLTGLNKPDAKAKPADSPLKDSLKDDLHAQPQLKPAAKAPDADGVSTLVKKVKDRVIDQGGTDAKVHDALVKTVSRFAGDEAAARASQELVAEVRAADKRVGRSFADTVAGDGGAASIVPAIAPTRLRGDDEEEDEEEEVEQPATAETGTSDG